MMKKHITVLLIALCVCFLLFAVYFALLVIKNINKDPVNANQNAEILLEHNHISQITEFSFDMIGEQMHLYRHNGHWYTTSNINLPLSSDAIKRLLSCLEYVSVIRIVDENCDDFDQYGLATPKYTLKFVHEGAERIYCFGNLSDYYSGYYFKSDQSNKVYIISSQYVEIFKVELEELLELDTLPDLSNIQHISFTSVNGALFNFDAKECSDDEKELLDTLSSVEIDRYIDHGKSVYGTYNLTQPAKAVIDNELELYFAAGESEEIIYLLINDSEIIYTVKSEKLEKLLDFINKSL